jgi:hypothetical protein
MPIVIAQYPDFFNANRWLLPGSVSLVMICWIAPFAIPRNIVPLVLWICTLSKVWIALSVATALLLTTALGVGCVDLFRFHARHLASVIEKEGPHPIIGVGATSVVYKPDTRTVTVTVSFINSSAFDVETRVTLWLMWDGQPLPNDVCTPKSTWNEREISMAPQPYYFWLQSSCTLPPDADSQWVNEKALISAAASATYADRRAATEYDFAGSVRRKQNFVDVVTTHRFARPREAAPY